MCCVQYVCAQVLNIPFCILFSWGWSHVDQIFCARKPFVFSVFHKHSLPRKHKTRYLRRSELEQETLAQTCFLIEQRHWNFIKLWSETCSPWAEILEISPTSEIFDVQWRRAVACHYWLRNQNLPFLYSPWYCCLAALEPPLSHPCASSAVKMFHQSVISLHWSHI